MEDLEELGSEGEELEDEEEMERLAAAMEQRRHDRTSRQPLQ